MKQRGRLILSIAVCLGGVAALFSLASRAQPQPGGAQPSLEQNEASLVRARAEWFLEGRRLKDGSIPSVLRMNAAKQISEAKARSGPDGAWVFIGPQPTDGRPNWRNVSGRVNAIAIDPRDSNTVYIGGAAGGVWKTVDGGARWTPTINPRSPSARWRSTPTVPTRSTSGRASRTSPSTVTTA